MKKLLLMLFCIFFANLSFSQKSYYWSKHKDQDSNIITHKAVARQSFPKEFKLFDLNISQLREDLFSIVGKNASGTSTIISLPNADGKIEQFEVYEASNFEPDLQAQFPEIRAYSGKGLTDKSATLKLSISPQGIQTMVFRTETRNEFIEAYSQDYKTYAVFRSSRDKGHLAWTCSTEEQKMVDHTKSNYQETNRSSAGQLKVYRLAQSCNAEYANYFGATNSSQVGLVLAAFNATLTRCNGVYEKDLALHLNLVASSTNIIYYDAATDPYSTNLGQWNTQLQNAINTSLTGPSTSLAANNAAYDIGHMFGASGGGGNAGCIGCICVDGVSGGAGATKGRGITSPADGIPQGDNFDIDYVTHEVGHQLGGNHTFSNSNEGAGVSKEVGSGITIMGYAGITAQDVAMHSIDIFHEATIEQIQNNLATKSCGTTTNISANNATPVVGPLNNYTIPISTPFVLTGSATDANPSDVLTYCWEQNDDGGGSTGAASSASPTKVIGPNFLTFPATTSPSRYFPRLSSIIANSATTAATGNDAGILTEALSSVSRVLNFRLTVRDNSPYVSTIGSQKVGQTAYRDMAVNVVSAAGPFVVTSPNSNVSWSAGTNQNVTWNVAGTTSNGVNTPFVDIFLSTDGGQTYPIQLANKVPNDGSETVSIPNNVGSSNRLMVKGNQNIFFDISNANFSVTSPASTFSIAQSSVQSTIACTLTTTTYTFEYKALNGFSGTTTFSAAGLPTGATANFSPSSMTTDGTVTMTVSNLASAPSGDYAITVTGTSGATTKVVPFYLYLGLGDPVLTTPANNASGQNTSLTLSWDVIPAATSYDVQVSTNNTFTAIVSSGNVTTNSYNLSGLSQGTEYFWRVQPKNATCTSAFGSPNRFTTGTISCASASSTNVPVAISSSGTPTITSTLNIPSGGIISDVNVTMDITHTWINDLTATLTSPSGTVVQLFSRECSPSSSINNIAATFDDSGVAIVCGNNPGISGTVTPRQALSSFNNSNSTGTWTLTISDAFNQDGGSLNSWSLNICTVQPLGTEEFELKDFILYPNPNNGSFTVKFTSASSNDVAINVFDISGREVYTKSFSNSGNFNQNIELNNVQAGVYMVSVTDGSQKIMKKVIIE